MLELAAYERGLCDCGVHESLKDPKRHHYQFETTTCPICAGAARLARIQANADEEEVKALGEKPNPAAPRSADGRKTHLQPAEPPASSAQAADDG